MKQQTTTTDRSNVIDLFTGRPLDEVTDRIVVSIENHELIQQTLASFQSYISNEVLADDIRLVDSTATEALEIVEGVSVGISVGVVG